MDSALTVAPAVAVLQPQFYTVHRLVSRLYHWSLVGRPKFVLYQAGGDWFLWARSIRIIRVLLVSYRRCKWYDVSSFKSDYKRSAPTFFWEIITSLGYRILFLQSSETASDITHLIFHFPSLPWSYSIAHDDLLIVLYDAKVLPLSKILGKYEYQEITRWNAITPGLFWRQWSGGGRLKRYALLLNFVKPHEKIS